MRSPELAPLSGNIVRSPVGSTRTTTTPEWPLSTTRLWCRTPSASNSLTSAEPAASLPTWPTIVALASVRVNQAATFPAAPPP